MRQFVLSLALGLLAIAPAVRAAAPLFHASFENSNSGWTTLRGAASVDPAMLHEGQKSMRVESGADGRDAAIQSGAVSLTIGKRYELSGWIKTDRLLVRDANRTPVAIGAALAMASMPFDVHSESLGGSRDWTRVQVHFKATKAEDNILLIAGTGGTWEGKAWFAGISIDEASTSEDWPTRAAISTYGPAYRYPTGGWIYLHIEGSPYERGYQHGRLMANEIVQYMERCAAQLDTKDKTKSWDLVRNTANALFLNGFDHEILEEMKGIAEGASDAGARWQGRRIDLVDMVVVNTTVELGQLREALRVTPNGLEGLHLESPNYLDPKRDVSISDHCSAFAATGRATRDGRMVIGHTTWWPLTLAEQTNVLLDIKPVAGHRVLMQSYPGGIESGTDWYQNDSGLVLTETTIRQSPFNKEGTPIAYRARKAIQYGDNIDQVVHYLGTKNNGLYTNEWLIGDAKSNEIAMYELGTYKTRLYRSSKNDWFGGTEGFYWGNNDAKDLNVRLEEQPDPNGEPEYIPYVPENRDLKWQELYREYKGKIDEQFGFLAFRTAPLVSSSAMDAKIATADMASHLMLWADFGKPNQREWAPSESEKDNYSKNNGLYDSGYRLITAEPPASLHQAASENATALESSELSYDNRLWKGWVLPASDADVWFASGSAAYYRDLKSGALSNAMAAHWARYRALSSRTDLDALQRFDLATHQGAIFLDQLRRQLGDNRFFGLMSDFFRAHTTKTVTAQAFLADAGVKFEMPRDPGGPMYVIGDIGRRLASAILVYGTRSDTGANRYAAEQLRKKYLDRFERAVPIRKDFEVTVDELRAHDVIFVGRPETNSALAAWQEKIGLDTVGASFRIAGHDHASELEALTLAAANPLDPHRMVLVLAGNSALQTVLLAQAGTDYRAGAQAGLSRNEYSIFNSGNESASGFLH